MKLGFHTQKITDPEVLDPFLDMRRDSYMRGDLVEPYWSQADFFGAFQNGELQGVVLRYNPIQPPPVISVGAPEAVAALYEYIAPTTPQLFYHAQDDHLNALRQFYTPDPAEHMHVWRMVCTPETFQPIELADVRLLTSADAEAAHTLHDIPAEMLDTGTFFGIEAEGQLAALAGTHIVSDAGIGVVGWVFTHPNYRGKGYATRVTSAVTAELLRRGATVIALNVIQANSPAVRAYQKVGFQINNALWEGSAVRK